MQITKLFFHLSINQKKSKNLKINLNPQIQLLKKDIFLLSNIFFLKIARFFIKNLTINIQVSKINLFTAVLLLKKFNKTQLNYLNEISTYDVPSDSSRFTLNYILSSLFNNTVVVLNVKLGELDSVDSLVSIFKAAGWAEREIWDMFGICFLNHPDLRRILTDYNFNGHPLRKDFPLSGYTDIFFDEKNKKTVYVPIELAQEFRNYNYLSAWKKTL